MSQQTFVLPMAFSVLGAGALYGALIVLNKVLNG